MKYETYIFDMDGTILDTIEDLTVTTNYAMEKMGYPKHTIEEVKWFVGNGIMMLIKRAVPEGTSEEDIKRTHTFFMEHYKDHCNDKTGPYEGIIELLNKLKAADKKLAVVSNKADGPVKVLAQEIFPGLFDVAIGERPGINKKPARDMVDEAIKQLGADRDKTVYIGDTNVDFETAKNSELDCILVSWGFRGREFIEQYDAEYYVDRPEEIINI
ncbi:MAG: HAD family hydrolase [Lachnospiraceae bacterium]|nr:HAD family hydrolase [Lachnospiraceae bacterium]